MWIFNELKVLISSIDSSNTQLAQLYTISKARGTTWDDVSGHFFVLLKLLYFALLLLYLT